MASLAHSAEVAVLTSLLLGTSETLNPYAVALARIDLALAHLASLKPANDCRTCGGYGEQDDGERKFPCRACRCGECGTKLDRQGGVCVNARCDASRGA